MFKLPIITNQITLLHFSQLSKNPRYGFNGKEKDPEGMGGGGATYDYGFRIYNPAIGRFLSVDPLTATYPYYTPYQFAGNKSIVAIDLDGLEELDYRAILLNATQIVLIKPTEEEIKFITNTENVGIIHFSGHNVNLEGETSTKDHKRIDEFSADATNYVKDENSIFKLKSFDVIVLKTDEDVEHFMDELPINIKTPALRDVTASKKETEAIHYMTNLKDQIMYDVIEERNILVTRYYSLNELSTSDFADETKTSIILDQATQLSNIMGSGTDFATNYDKATEEDKKTILQGAKEKLQERDVFFEDLLNQVDELDRIPYLSNDGVMQAVAKDHLNTDPNKKSIVIGDEQGVVTTK